MGVVYEAHDSKLDRTVALKFLPPSFTDSGERKKRFLNEARSASALNHTNTCTIHEIDETPDGQLYIVMPAYRGSPLDKKLRDEELSLEEAISIAVQVCEGLKAAHHHDIIHRDIKTGNIFVTDDGHAIIMDFGLARKENTSQLTKTGQAIGTVPYMSPEQAMGDEIDQRTDIWSMGVVLYELFTGRNPFPSEYPQAVIYSILNEEPEYITEVRPDLPSELGPVVHKALEKNKEDRYQHADELLADLKEIQNLIRGYSGSRTAFSIKPLLRSRIFSPVPLTSIFILIGALVSFLLVRPGDNISFEDRDWVMIADFQNETDEEVFSTFLNIILEVGLYQSSYVNMYDRNSTMNILKNELDIKDVKSLTETVVEKAAEHKDVHFLLLPKIDYRDETYVLSAKIRNIQTAQTVDIDPVEAESREGVLQAMDKLVKEIRLTLGEPPSSISETSTPIAQATTSSLEALKLFAEGSKIKLTDQSTGYDLIKQAVELDSTFALAHAELGMHYYINNYRQKGEQHYQKALAQMDRLTLRERLWIRAIVADWRGNRQKAIENYKSYLTQYPDDYTAWWRLGYTYLITQQPENCIDAFSRVVEFEPEEASALVNIASCYNSLGKNEQALVNYERAFQVRPDMKKGIYVNSEYGFLLVKMGRMDEARETFEIMLDNKRTRSRGLRSLALLNTYTGNFSTAIDHFREAVLLNQSFEVPLSEMRNRMFLARAYQVKGMEEEFTRQINEIELLVNEMNLSPLWLSAAGRLFARHGYIEKAEPLVPKIQEKVGDVVASSGVNRNISQDEAFYHLLSGEVALARGKFEEALESLEIANNIVNVPEAMAHGYYEAGKLDYAIEYYNQVISDSTLNREQQLRWILAHYQLGKIYEERGDIPNAVQYYERFIEIWQNGDEDLVTLRDARDRLNRLKKQVGLIPQVRARDPGYVALNLIPVY